MNDSKEEIILSVTDMCAFVDDKLGEAIAELLSEARRTVTTVEFTLAAMLGQSVGRSCESSEQLEIQLAAYTMFLRAYAEGSFKISNAN